MSHSGGTHLLPEVFFTFRCSRAHGFTIGNVHLHAVHEKHDKFNIPGKHKIYSTCATALCPGAGNPCFWDSPNSMHVQKEKAPLTTRL